ncbi:cyanobactin biosynthesis system PatB/AcyB/McaB family protein [Streptomyces gobiensis]|uniref:cyanobactin biosynthesis system PatB/AcyB/McaB family protein n=1 Tax=Streptomyces gobiensis TaxID=2875706 RepID=UPI001E5A06C9|nr:cyanobactin biosynthesis system PatB/AcyB/McaB family protein [Streptomyces gobiensis]UGY91096.1 cyanobactin biosynthesis system PatB/AcyB/McaB family protein [Streptomyces gobiensis]
MAGHQPRQAPPVRRPELVRPHELVDVVHGSPAHLVKIRMDLMHGANVNDPQHFAWPGYDRMQVSSHG